MRHFDPHLFDLLYDLTASVNHAGGEIDVICGYRTPGATNSCGSAGLPALLSTVFICKRKPSIFAYPAFPPRRCGIPRCACNAAEWVIIALPTSFTWTWDASAVGSLVFTPDRIARRQSVAKFVIVAVNVIVEIHLAIRIDNRGGVQNQHRNWIVEVDLSLSLPLSWPSVLVEHSNRACRAAPTPPVPRDAPPVCSHD